MSTGLSLIISRLRASISSLYVVGKDIPPTVFEGDGEGVGYWRTDWIASGVGGRLVKSWVCELQKQAESVVFLKAGAGRSRESSYT